MQRVLIIFVRNPELGKVKTRLSATLGNEQTLDIYRFLLEKTRQTAEYLDIERLLFYSEKIQVSDAWSDLLYVKQLQDSGDLGQRMHHAFATAFRMGAEKVVIIGSDCPTLDGIILQSAFEALDHHDFVLGPTPDGGYYLLGMKYLEASLFEGIAWSTGTVKETTLLKIKSLQKSCGLTPMLSDIDTESDWNNYLNDKTQTWQKYSL